jgi:hypothetical protein
VSQGEQENLRDEKQDAGNGKKEESMAKVGDADGRVGGWGTFGVRKEEGLVFGAYR